MSKDKELRIFSRQTGAIVYVLQDYLLRPHLYGVGDPRQPSPRVTLGDLTFQCVVEKVK